MILVFLIQFFNTGPLLLLVHGDLSQLGIKILEGVNQGYHPDFTVRWYKDVGYLIIDTMQFNIFAPIIEFGIAFTVQKAFQILDKTSKTGTKKHSIESYISLFAGP